MRVTAILFVGLLVPTSVPQCLGQVVQLPTFESFSVGTTVVVPDRGSAFLGGVDRARYESYSSGVPGWRRLPGAGPWFGDRGTSASVRSSGAAASATIVDHREWDEAILSRAGRHADRRSDDPVVRKAARISQHVGRRTTDRTSETIRRGQAAAAWPRR